MKTLLLLLIIFFTGNSIPQDLFTQANQNSVNKDDVVAQIDTITITAEEFFYNYEFGPAFPKRKSDAKETHLNYLINEKLLALEGFNEGIMEQDYPKDFLSDIQSDIAAEEMFREEILPKIEIKEDEIEKIIQKKRLEYEIRWLYSENEPSINTFLKQLNAGISFDTLFNSQLNDSVFIYDRQMTSTLFDIYKKNPILAQILDTLKAGTISAPVHTEDGWYIIKTDNISKNLITSETENDRFRSESIDALKQGKMASFSDEFIKRLFDDENPVIKRDAFNILRSYLGKFILAQEIYSEWHLDTKLDSALSNLGLKRGDKYPGITLVSGNNSNYSLDEFIIWYRNREQYIKFVKKNLNDFSSSLENLIWVMVRDKMLAATAFQKGFYNVPWVKKQSQWWKEKIAYSAYKNNLEKSIKLTSNEIQLVKEKKKSQSEILSGKFSEKILHKILELKERYKITVNKDILDKIKVSSENDKKAIDMYFIKRGNLIPRTLFPSIDNEWISWE